MNRNTRKHLAVAIAAVWNVALILCVLGSVISAFNEAEAVSFAQNIENARTLTNASANKVELEYRHHTQELRSAAAYVNGYRGVGMTERELRDFFAAFYADAPEARTWELVDGELNGETGERKGFSAVALGGADADAFVYKSQAYPELAKIFCTASEATLGEVHYTGEFTDASPALAKSAAITATVRVRGADADQYKTLMLLLKSSYINDLMASNNEVDTVTFFDFSNIIVDNDGNYVISNSQFQGTNFADYMALYNDDFTEADADALCAKLRGDDYYETLYYKNSRGQDCAYTIVPVQNSDRHVLSIVPIDSFHSSYNFTHSFSTFALYFGALFAADLVFVGIINRQLRRKTREAQAANLAKSEFLSSMSHDIRTPMNAIIGMTLLAEEQLKTAQPDVDSLKDCVKTIQLSGNHLLTLINDILDISKIENGKVALAPEDFSISESIEKMLEIMQPQIKEKEFVFETHIVNVSHEFVHADELRINQVYINILSNAIKYTAPGGRISLDFIEEPLPGRRDAARFIYRVSDTGIGMDAEFLKTIFNRFSRAVDTRVNTTQGTGLGMAISKQLVDLMGGSITVESQLHVGSTFTVTLELPLADVRVAQISLQGLQVPPSFDLHVLVAEDNNTNWKVLSRLLLRYGIRAERAENGKAAVAALEGGAEFDLVLMDIQMPLMNGYEATKAIRRLSDARRAATPIYAMTADTFAEDVAKCLQSGMDGHLAKPIEIDKLLRVLTRISSRHSEAT